MLQIVQPHEIGIRSRLWLPGYDSSWVHIQRSIRKKGVVESSLILALAHTGVELPVKLLLEKGANIEARSEYFHRTPLILAARRGFDSVVRLLLVKGADIEAGDRWGQTALILAARWGHGEVVRLLIENGVNIHANTAQNKTALHVAAHGGFEAIVHLLIEKGADVMEKDIFGKTASDNCETYPAIRKLLKDAEVRSQ